MHHFGLLYADVKITNPLTVEAIILGLGAYFFPVNLLPKQNHAMRRGMRKMRGLKVRRYAARLIDLNEYLYLLPGAQLTESISVREINGILLNSMPNIWSKQAYVHGFDCKYITFKWLLICLNAWRFLNIYTKV